jgi:hypothetical protein
MTFADLPEDRQSDAKDVEAAIRRYLTAVNVMRWRCGRPSSPPPTSPTIM